MEILLDVSQAAAACSLDEETLLRWTQDGIMPAPLLADGLPRWTPSTLGTWAADGCPKSEPLHHRVMNAIRKGNIEDWGRDWNTSRNLLDEMENHES